MESIRNEEQFFYLPKPLSMTDEERDIEAFRAYLRELPPEALWDVYTHIDEERYPRRREAVRREMSRSHLNLLLYSDFEARLRALFFASVIFGVLAAVLHGIPLLMAEMALASQNFGGDRVTGYDDAMRCALEFSTLTAREEATYRNLCAFFRGLTELCLAAIAVLLPVAAFRAARRRLRPDVVLTGLFCAAFAFGLLRFALG